MGKNKEAAKAAFSALEAKVSAMGDKELMGLFTDLKAAAYPTEGTQHSIVYNLFGVDTPKIGAVVSYEFAGMHGSKGTRMNGGEKIAAFVARLSAAGEELTIKYDAASIMVACQKLRKQGYGVVADSDKREITFLSDKPESAE
jgi:hypothetical protein